MCILCTQKLVTTRPVTNNVESNDEDEENPEFQPSNDDFSDRCKCESDKSDEDLYRYAYPSKRIKNE
jgi:hypothetical protein